AENTTLGDTIPESSGYAAMMGQPTDRFAAVKRRQDLDRVLGTLRGSDLALRHRAERPPTRIKIAFQQAS
ncbi:MAG: hypothetical protein WB462_04410, partial [Solirubrobacterales bacterium]